MNYATIKRRDVANGPGVRVSLFVSGCTHACPGCFNPEAWDFDYGQPFTPEVEDRLLADLAPDFVKGFSLLGGEPFHPKNQPALAPFLRRVRAAYPDKSIWCYTGYLFDRDLQPGGAAWTEHTQAMLADVDVLVDGPFVEAEKDLSLRFRGSANQRILLPGPSQRAGAVVLWDGM
jgi:anaerobic ribonucleoside-triphosphate reductase activating protein